MGINGTVTTKKGGNIINDYEKRREEEHKKTAEIRVKLEDAATLAGYEVEKREEDRDMGRVFAYEPGTAEAKRDDKAGVYLYYSAGYGSKRIGVSGIYLRHKSGEYVGAIYFTPEERDAIKAGTYSESLKEAEYRKIIAPRITISPEKSAEKIAQDIKRRFLPAFLEYLRRTREQIESADDYQKTSEKSLETVKGEPLAEGEARERKFTAYTKAMDGREYGVRIHAKASRRSVDIEISNLRPEEAARVRALVQGFIK